MHKRRPQTSVKQILVRDFNWRMGNLRRIYFSVGALDPDLKARMQELVQEQMDRERFKHEAGLTAIATGNPGRYWDEYLSRATGEAERNKRALQMRGDHKIPS